MLKTEFKTVKVLDIVFDPSNPNKMSDGQLNALRYSLKKFGQLKPPVIDQTMTVCDGEHQIRAYMAEGLGTIQVIQVECTPAQRRLIRQTMNKLHGSHDLQLDAEEYKSILEEQNFTELSQLLAIEEAELMKLVNEADELNNPFRDKEENFDSEQVLKEPKYKVEAGDVYTLGNHRLMCGDSTKEEDVTKLMNGQTADLLLTDPPYNVNYEYNLYQDNKTEEEYLELCTAFFSLSEKFTNAQIITPGTINLCLWSKIKKWKSIAPWIKKNAMNNGEISRLRLWEPIIFYGTFPERRATDLFEHNIKGEKIEHSCPKPLDLFTDLLNSFQPKSTLDLFGGSGTTIIASEKTNRNCFMMEIDPAYCSVIIERWEAFTGKKAVKVENAS